MKILFCAHRLPYPAVGGGKTETFEMIAGLVDRGHELTLVTYGGDPELATEMEREVGCSVELLPGVPDRTPRNLLRNLVSRDPLPVMKARTDRYQRAVQNLLPEADILHLHALQTSFLAASLETSVPIVIRFNNVKYLIYRQFAAHTDNPAKAAYAYFQYLKTRRFEAAIPSESDLTLTISEADKDLLEDLGSGGRLGVLPPGVDLEEFQARGGETERCTVTFFGSMDYHPNEEAALWFANHVLPRLRARFDDLTFEIVGKNPPASIQSLNEHEDIHVTGFVEDIGSYIDRATVIVIPIRVGTGVRIKVLHALAMGKAIVSTPLGVQGITVEDGRHVSIAEDPEEFADAVEELLADSDRRETYGRNARTVVETHHDWSIITEQLEHHYRQLMDSTISNDDGGVVQRRTDGSGGRR